MKLKENNEKDKHKHSKGKNKRKDKIDEKGVVKKQKVEDNTV